MFQTVRADMRSIPARAGETVMGSTRIPLWKVDPRACGGDFRRRLELDEGRGRSPRVRGRHHRGWGHRGRLGSIPARAGETYRLASWGHRAGVDPRACGGDPPRGNPSRHIGGRSPRVRGRPAEVARGRQLQRSIPARAGETIALCQERVTQGSIPARAGETRRYSGRDPSRGVDPRACGGDALMPVWG